MADRFDLLERIGKGGMGVVWKARDRGTGEVVALKLLHAIYADEADYLVRFEREVDIARRIDSPYVVKVLGYGQQGGLPYIAMEFIEGQPLRQLIRERGKLSWEEARPILLQVAEGLDAAHRAGVIHRDVKPGNILMSGDGTAKLADFGISRALEMTALTGSSTMLGTPAYMAPEDEVTAASDLYALGCVLFEMLAGSPPFAGDSQREVIRRHMRDAPDLSRLPTEAHSMVAWLLEKEPAARPTDAAALARALRGWSPSAAGAQPAAQSPVSAAAAPPGRSEITASGIAVSPTARGGPPILAPAAGVSTLGGGPLPPPPDRSNTAAAAARGAPVAPWPVARARPRAGDVGFTSQLILTAGMLVVALASFAPYFGESISEGTNFVDRGLVQFEWFLVTDRDDDLPENVDGLVLLAAFAPALVALWLRRNVIALVGIGLGAAFILSDLAYVLLTLNDASLLSWSEVTALYADGAVVLMSVALATAWFAVVTLRSHVAARLFALGAPALAGANGILIWALVQART